MVDISKPQPPHDGCLYDSYDRYYCEACDWRERTEQQRSWEFYQRQTRQRQAGKTLRGKLTTNMLDALERTRSPELRSLHAALVTFMEACK